MHVLGIELEDLFNEKYIGKGRVPARIKYEPRKKADVRERWTKLMKDNSGASRAELQVIDKGTHIWLLRHDREWYYKVSPKRKKTKVHENKKLWYNIDKEAVIIVDKALKIIMKDNKKPIRITQGYILRFILDKIKINNIEKLPLTKRRIEESVESLGQFRDRKMKWAIISLLEEG